MLTYTHLSKCDLVLPALSAPKIFMRASWFSAVTELINPHL